VEILPESIDMTTAPFLSSSWYRVAHTDPSSETTPRSIGTAIAEAFGTLCRITQTGRVHRLSPAGHMIVAAMDGTRTVDQLWQSRGHLAEEAPSQMTSSDC